ncbi:MAG: DUF1636 domain-containing protein [Rhodobacteraceae bacterium]|nr:DUF1636 domain-containing protein [Paracoccaceae bacterium]
MSGGPTWITVCDTCKRPGWTGSEGATDGALLAGHLDDAASQRPNVHVRRHSCLMGCPRACNIAIQAQGKLAYTLAEFTPDRAAADAIAAFAALHAKSDTGQVPYRTWPDGVRGHFVTRHPPLPE